VKIPSFLVFRKTIYISNDNHFIAGSGQNVRHVVEWRCYYVLELSHSHWRQSFDYA
jgi:hypothetical protein